MGLSLMAYTNNTYNSMCGQELASFPGSPTPEHEYVTWSNRNRTRT